MIVQHQALRELHQGLGNHYRGALSQPHSVCPHHLTKGLEEHRKLPQWGCILYIFDVRKKPSGTPLFSIFERWWIGGAPKCHVAWENFPPLSPSRRACATYVIQDDVMVYVVQSSHKIARMYLGCIYSLVHNSQLVISFLLAKLSSCVHTAENQVLRFLPFNSSSFIIIIKS